MVLIKLSKMLWVRMKHVFQWYLKKQLFILLIKGKSSCAADSCVPSDRISLASAPLCYFVGLSHWTV